MTRGIELNLPIVSAAMDTVTESQMRLPLPSLAYAVCTKTWTLIFTSHASTPGEKI
ncbi:MAG: IMP dehydrogenase [Moraxella sp.]